MIYIKTIFVCLLVLAVVVTSANNHQTIHGGTQATRSQSPISPNSR